jgi:hypothetical protein
MRSGVFAIRCAVFLSILLATVPLLARAQGDRGLAWGVYTGWSHGLGWEFDWHYRSSVSDRTTLQAHAGTFIRYDLSRAFGLQVDLNYQAGINEWEFSYWDFPEESGSDRFGITSLSLQGVLHGLRFGRIGFFALLGGGPSFGRWGKYGGFSRSYAHLTAGLCIRIRLKAGDSALALLLGSAVVHLIDPHEHATRTADYLRFTGGVEF